MNAARLLLAAAAGCAAAQPAAAADEDTISYFCELQKVDNALSDHPKVYGPTKNLDFVAVMKPNAPFVGNVLKTHDPDGLLAVDHFGGITSVERDTFQFYSGTPGASDYRMLNLRPAKGQRRRAMLGSTMPEYIGSCTSTSGETGLALFDKRLENTQ